MATKIDTDRLLIIHDFVQASKLLDFCVQAGFPPGLIDWLPSGIDDPWSIRSHIVHVLDADLMLHHRVRFAIAQPGITVPVWDHLAWKNQLVYDVQNATVSISMLRMLRAITGHLLESLSQEQWDLAHSIHPLRGRMDLPAWLRFYTEHIKEHLGYIKRNISYYEKEGSPNLQLNHSMD